MLRGAEDALGWGVDPNLWVVPLADDGRSPIRKLRRTRRDISRQRVSENLLRVTSSTLTRY